jgi:hypothetical protein
MKRRDFGGRQGTWEDRRVRRGLSCQERLFVVTGRSEEAPPLTAQVTAVQGERTKQGHASPALSGAE